ncbi:hypothetical protein E2562_013427 [Oryza meyeriana var. granulata]|uniref:Uncharacterized protein n=1 Tax=Oryza meyeriana var. granulata TaxID=110450 RepID=A0A6G1EA89_9ORYZ|nr:hypothetical protein E2562_013427 [Oryza meyeriana var. granulata]
MWHGLGQRSRNPSWCGGSRNTPIDLRRAKLPPAAGLVRIVSRPPLRRPFCANPSSPLVGRAECFLQQLAPSPLRPPALPLVGSLRVTSRALPAHRHRPQCSYGFDCDDDSNYGLSSSLSPLEPNLPPSRCVHPTLFMYTLLLQRHLVGEIGAPRREKPDSLARLLTWLPAIRAGRMTASTRTGKAVAPALSALLALIPV